MPTLPYPVEISNKSLPLLVLEPPYVKSPDGRGTVELLPSCLLTFFTCIWTAVHPNIVPLRSEWSYFWYKLGWGLNGIFLPEIVICAAFIQRRESRRVLNRWRNHFIDLEASQSGLQSMETPTTVLPATVADLLGKSGGFLAVSGGFVVQRSVPVKRAKDAPTSLTADDETDCVITSLTAEGFIQLLEAGVFDILIRNEKLTEDNFHWRVFEDKGKANNVSLYLRNTSDVREYARSSFT